MTVGLGNATTLLLEDASLSATQGTVASKATLALSGSDASFSGDISLGYRSTLSVISPSTLEAGKLLTGNGAIFSFTLSSGMTTPLLTYTGAFTLDGTASFTFLYNNFTPEANDSFNLIQFTSPSAFDSQYLSQIFVENGTLSYHEDSGMLSYTYTALPALEWTAGDGRWSVSQEWNGGTADTRGRDVLFTAAGEGTVTLADTVTPGKIGVVGGSYTWEGEGSIGGHSQISISGEAGLTVKVDMEGRPVVVEDSAVATFAKEGGSSLERLSVAEGATAVFVQDYTLYAADDSQSATADYIHGTLRVTGTEEAGTTLTFAADKDWVMKGNVEADAFSSLHFTNGSAVQDITYTLEQGSGSIAGSVIIGGTVDTRGTTLVTTVEKANTATTYSLQDKGTLELTGTGSFSNTVGGVGTLKVSSGVDVSFAIQNHTVTWNPEVTLRVEGSATIGAAETYDSSTSAFSGTDNVIATSIGNKVEINGGNLKVVYDTRATNDIRMESSSFRLPSLTLGNQGTLELLPQLSEWRRWGYGDPPPVLYNYHSQCDIASLTVEKTGGTIHQDAYTMAASGGSSYYIPFESRIAIGSMSGNGGLNLEADSSYYATIFTIGDARAYSGRLTVNSYRNSRDMNVNIGILSVASLELGDGCTLTGGVLLKSDNLLENFLANKLKLEDSERRSMLGVQGTVTIGGLSDEGRTYLYAGTLDTLKSGGDMSGYQGTDGTAHVFDYEKERNNIQAALASPEQEATLIIDNTGNDTYAGTVLGKDREGTATLNLVKRGTGTQSFTGDMSQWGGDISVEEGTLAFGSGLSARHIALSSNATFNAEGNTLALLQGGGFSTIGVARTDLSALQAQATVGTGDVLSFSSEATHTNAHLDLSQGGSLSMGATLDLHGNTLTMSLGNPLAFTLDWNFLASIKKGDTFDLLLFTNVGEWVITGSEEGAAAVADGLVSYKASQLLQSECLTDQSQLIYDGSSIILTSAVGLPEPATATLSLLALSLLAARRRRK